MDAVEKKEAPTACYVCAEELDKDHTFIQCPQGHHLCEEHTEQWITMSVMPTLDDSTFPPKCAICRAAINSSIFERNVKSRILLEKFHFAMLATTMQLGKGEIWAYCPNCRYREVRNTTSPPLFVYCRKGGCQKISCYFCHGEVTARQLRHYQRREEEDYGGLDVGSSDARVHKHIYTCAELGPIKQEIEAVIERGTKNECPKCGLSGVKNDGCTHMSCPNCQQVWCYCCGKPVEEVDRAPNQRVSIWDHNADWATNPDRCPFLLTQIHDVDVSWPGMDRGGTDLDCVIFYHRRKTLRLLAAYDEEHPGILDRQLEAFPQILGGYSIRDVRAVDLETPMYLRNPRHNPRRAQAPVARAPVPQLRRLRIRDPIPIPEDDPDDDGLYDDD